MYECLCAWRCFNTQKYVDKLIVLNAIYQKKKKNRLHCRMVGFFFAAIDLLLRGELRCVSQSRTMSTDLGKEWDYTCNFTHIRMLSLHITSMLACSLARSLAHSLIHSITHAHSHQCAITNKFGENSSSHNFNTFILSRIFLN